MIIYVISCYREKKYHPIARRLVVDSNKKKMTGVTLPIQLLERIENYLDLPFTAVKSKRELFERAVTDFLDREEIVSAKIERELSRMNELSRK